MTPGNAESRHDSMVQAVNSMPSVAVVGATVAGLHVNDWLAIIGIVFILLQAAYLIWRWRRDARRERDRLAAIEAKQDNALNTDTVSL